MKTELKYAVIFVVLSFLWNCFEYIAGLHGKYIAVHPYLVTPFFLIMTGVIYYFDIREKKQIEYGRISYFSALKSGIILTLLIIILNPVFMYIFSEFINKDFYNAFIQYDIQEGNMNPSEAADYYNLRNFIVHGSVYRLIMGVAASAIIAFFVRKRT